MQLPTWDALALELAKHGYRPVHYVETFCPTCGDWRGSIEPESYAGAIPCPKCTILAAYTVLGRGFTRRETIPWFRVSPPVPKAWKLDTPDDDREWKGPRLPTYKPDAGKSADQSAEGVEASETIPKGEKTLSVRELAILRLLAEDLPPDSVAEKLNPPTNGRAVVMAMYRVRKVLHCSTTTGAVVTAMRQGLIS